MTVANNFYVQNFLLVDKEIDILKNERIFDLKSYKKQFNQMFWNKYQAWKNGKHSTKTYVFDKTPEQVYNYLKSSCEIFNEEQFKIDFVTMSLLQCANKYKVATKTINYTALYFGLTAKDKLKFKREV